MSMFENLTLKQREAVETTKQDLRVIACAGSGKTRVVATRIIHLIKNEKANPESIVAFTYTDKASKELKSRVYEYAKAEIGTSKGLGAMFIGTLHSYSMRLLQDHAEGYRTFELLDPIKLRLFMEKNWKEIGLQEIRLGKDKIKNFLEAMTILNENPTTKKVPYMLKEAYAKYCKFLINNKYLDFVLVMRKTDDELRGNDEMRKSIQEKLRFIIVDEYQDINPIQESIIQQLHSLGANLCAVGDDDQTIFQFRGSESENILEFHKRYAGSKQIILENNFRCSPAIVKLAEKIVAKNKRRFKKVMDSKAEIDYEEGDITWAEFDTGREEAKFIAERIKELTNSKKVNNSDIAVICRKRKSFETIIKALSKAEIPYIVDGVNELFNTTEARAMERCFDYLCHKDLPAWSSKENKEEFIKHWTGVHTSIKKENAKSLLDYLGTINADKVKGGNNFILQEIMLKIIQTLTFFEKEPDKLQEVCMYNLGMFSKVIHGFETIYYKEEPKTKLENFVEFMYRTARDKYAEGLVDKAHYQPDAVRILTIHGAKGLEFPVVFLPGLNDKTFPAGHFGEEEVWGKIVPTKSVENSKRFHGSLDDERKMFYVAVTRAQKLLFMTRPTTFTSQYENTYVQKQSLFLKEAKKSPFVVEWDDRIKYKNKKLVTTGEKANPIVLNFTYLTRYLECPYAFKLCFIYGFYEPLIEVYGYGKSIKETTIKIHTRKGKEVKDNREAVVKQEIARYFNTSFSSPEVKERLIAKATQLLNNYFEKKNKERSQEIADEKYIEVELGDNLLATGKTALMTNTEGGKTYTTAYDIITSSIPEAEAVTTALLQIRALGLEQSGEQLPDFVEVFNMDDMKHERTPITPQVMQATEKNVRKVSMDIRCNTFKRNEGDYCKRCFYRELCRKQ